MKEQFGAKSNKEGYSKRISSENMVREILKRGGSGAWTESKLHGATHAANKKLWRFERDEGVGLEVLVATTPGETVYGQNLDDTVYALRDFDENGIELESDDPITVWGRLSQFETRDFGEGSALYACVASYDAPGLMYAPIAFEGDNAQDIVSVIAEAPSWRPDYGDDESTEVRRYMGIVESEVFCEDQITSAELFELVVGKVQQGEIQDLDAMSGAIGRYIAYAEQEYGSQFAASMDGTEEVIERNSMSLRSRTVSDAWNRLLSVEFDWDPEGLGGVRAWAYMTTADGLVVRADCVENNFIIYEMDGDGADQADAPDDGEEEGPLHEEDGGIGY